MQFRPRIVLLFAVALLMGTACWGASITASIGVTPTTVTPGVYFADWGGNFYPGEVVLDTITPLTSTLSLHHTGALDYGNGDRVILDIVNNTGGSLTGINFYLVGGSYNTGSLQPSIGSLTAGPTFTITGSANPGAAGVSGATLSVTFAPLPAGASTALYVPIDLVLNSDHVADFAFRQTAISGVPEPSTLALGGLGLALLAAIRRRK